MLDRFFRLSENGTNVRTELLAGLTTFLTMAYIIFLQPQLLSGQAFGTPTGMDFGALTAATCLASALATVIMAFYANYPIALAPGMGENYFFVLGLLPAAAAAFAGPIATGQTTAWQIGLGVIFVSGVLFLGLSLLGVREALIGAISPSMRNAIAVGIGLFIALIGLRTSGLVVLNPKAGLEINPQMASPDLLVFFVGLLATAALAALRVRGAIVLGIAAAAALSIALKLAMPHLPESLVGAPAVANSMLVDRFEIATSVVAAPPSVMPVLWKMDLARAVSTTMIPFVLIFLFMAVFDTLGTLVGVSEQAGLVKDNRLPRLREALVADAVGTAAGAAMGMSTVTCYIESAAGVQQGGRTGLTALTVAVFFLLALFFGPVIAMVGSYPPITAPAVVFVGSMMMTSVRRVDWDDPSEALPAFLVILGIPATYSIADGLALGFIAYPLVKLFSGKGRQVKWLMYLMAAVLLAYFIFVRGAQVAG
ncbi:MAG: NCS2 family permease [Planctomycetota bacterium]